MEINDDHIIELIKGQAATTQAVNDLKASMEKGFTFIRGEHEKLDTRVGSVETKVWYGVGAASVLGIMSGAIVGLFRK